MLSIDLSEFELPVSSAPVSVSDIATLLRECKEVLEQELELADEDPEPPAPSAVPVPVNLSRKVLLPENQQVDVQSVLLLNRLYSIESKYLEGLQDLFLSSIFRNEILTQASRDGDSDHSKKDYATRHSGGAAINVHAFQFLRGHALRYVVLDVGSLTRSSD